MKQLLSCLLLLSLISCGEQVRVQQQSWANPVLGSDLENWYKVDELVYRSKQPDDDDIDDIVGMGIKRVLNLRMFHSDEDDLKSEHLSLSRVKMSAGSITLEQIRQSLDIILAEKSPILVHCWHGSDRTGAVIAAYRIVVQDWSKEHAIDELVNGPFGHHKMFDNIPSLIRALPTKELREQLDIH